MSRNVGPGLGLGANLDQTFNIDTILAWPDIISGRVTGVQGHAGLDLLHGRLSCRQSRLQLLQLGLSFIDPGLVVLLFVEFL